MRLLLCTKLKCIVTKVLLVVYKCPSSHSLGSYVKYSLKMKNLDVTVAISTTWTRDLMIGRWTLWSCGTCLHTVRYMNNAVEKLGAFYTWLCDIAGCREGVWWPYLRWSPQYGSRISRGHNHPSCCSRWWSFGEWVENNSTGSSDSELAKVIQYLDVLVQNYCHYFVVGS